MYKKHVKLEALKKYPTIDHLCISLETAQKTRGCTVELPWKVEGADIGYSLTVRVELGGQVPVWALYEQGKNSRILWSQNFTDMELLNDIIHFTAPPPKINKPLASILSQGLQNSVLDEKPSKTVASDTDKLVPPGRPDNQSPYPNNPNINQYPPNTPYPNNPNINQYPPNTPYPNNPNINQYPPNTPYPNNPNINQYPPNAPYPNNPYVNQYPPNTPYPNNPYPNNPNINQYSPNNPYPNNPNINQYPPNNPYPNNPNINQYPPNNPYPNSPNINQYPPNNPYPNNPNLNQYPPNNPYPNSFNASQNPENLPYQENANVGLSNNVAQAAQSLSLIQTGLNNLNTGSGGQALANKVSLDDNLIKKRPNIMLGAFLIEAKLVPEPTIDAALQLQDMIKAKTLSKAQAAVALRRTHERGGNVDIHIPEELGSKIAGSNDTKIQGPPLGQLLVDARILPASILKSALALQEVVRSGSINLDDALKTLILENKKVLRDLEVAKKQTDNDPQIIYDAIQLLINAGLMDAKDLEAANKTQINNGGKLSSILVQNKKVDSLILQIAVTACEYLQKNIIKTEQAIILLHYCQRSRVGIKDAMTELGFDIN